MAGDSDEQAWDAAGLLDPAKAEADDRRKLLRYLTSLGATLDDLVDADREGSLRLLAPTLLRRKLWVATAAEIASDAGVGLERVLQIWRAAGLPQPDPDEPAFRKQDAEAVRLFMGAVDLFGEDAAVEFTRSIGVALASIADSAMATFGINVAERFDEDGIGEDEQARSSALAAAMLVENLPAVLEALFLHHAEVAARRSIASTSSRAHTSRLAVGFVDIVESTALVQQLTPDGLAEAIGTFEQHATEIVGGRHGRVVKTLGDEVMFVIPDAAAACDIALALRDRMAADERLAGVRGAIAVGSLVRGYGDFYGPEVTAAARAVKEADPGAIVVLSPVRDEVDESAGPYEFRSIGVHELRGFEQPIELFVVERA